MKRWLCLMCLSACFVISVEWAATANPDVLAANRVATPHPSATATRVVLPTRVPPMPSPPAIDAQAAWFKVQPAAAEAWRITQDDHLRWSVRARDRGTTAAPAKRVLVLYTKGSSAYDTAISTILTDWHAKQIVADFTVVNTRGDEASGQQAIREATVERYDLIVGMGSDATAFLVARFRGGAIPVVSVAAKDPVLLGQMRDYHSGSGTNVAYTSLNVPVDVQLAYLRELRPQLQMIAVLYAASNDSAIQTQVKPLEQIAARVGVRIIPVVVEDDRRARSELAVKVPLALADIARTDPTLTHSVFWLTGSTSVFNEIATINAGAGSVPVVSAVPDVVQAGDASAVLAIGVSFQSNAHLAAVYGAAILTGVSRAGDLPVGTVSPPDIAINFKRARAIGLKIPFHFFESASFIYNDAGQLVRKEGQVIR